MQIPIDFTSPVEARAKFDRMFDERYPGKTLGQDISFEELDHDLQIAYAEFNHEYYLLEFEKAAEMFNIAYAYYIVPEPWLGDDYVMYLLDCARETRESAPDQIDVCLSYPQVIERHRILWEAWNTGRSPEGYDTFDNEFGKTYAYYTPLYINGEKLGLIATEVDIDAVNSAILNNTLIQFATIGGILVISVLLMLIFINRAYIKRIGALESGVREYADSKNVSVADRIEANASGKHEIASLSRQTAEMVRELDRHIYDMQSITAERERFKAELDVATKIQAEMLPSDFPKRDDIELFAAMIPAKEVGGDFYDFFFVDDDHIALVMADVAGKGIPASLLCVVTKVVLRDQAVVGGTPAEILDRVNKIVLGNNAGLFVTIWLGILDLKTGNVQYVNAGHEYPVIIPNSGAVDVFLKDNCVPIAAIDDPEFVNETIQLRKGDNLLLYTDGVTEAKAIDGSRFGMERFIKVLERSRELDPEGIVAALKREVDAFQPENDPFDDVTIMSVVWKGGR